MQPFISMPFLNVVKLSLGNTSAIEAQVRAPPVPSPYLQSGRFLVVPDALQSSSQGSLVPCRGENGSSLR